MIPSLPFLIDFDGVFKINNSPAPDVKHFLSFISQNKIRACIISNSTLRTGDLIKEFFNSQNIELAIPAIQLLIQHRSMLKRIIKKSPFIVVNIFSIISMELLIIIIPKQL